MENEYIHCDFKNMFYRCVTNCNHYRLQVPVMKILKEYSKYSKVQKKGLHAFGYNSAESEPIWMKSGKLWAKCWGLAVADFGAIRLRGSQNLLSGKYRMISPIFRLKKFTTFSTQQPRSVRWIRFSERNFENFTIKGLFFPKNVKMLKKFQVLRLQPS